ncbi:hypothetical protein L1987_31450 [Smallanthus sonchifolius]|uniref:Uncharacterized protein n=1 Tax=Smallanthus sonchifolius TaxID=185202 RepID=A0ACB9I7F2_9ASTR|nr:hypothetical protein L1987_31450 [Smallanthus sonchifolius]
MPATCHNLEFVRIRFGYFAACGCCFSSSFGQRNYARKVIRSVNRGYCGGGRILICRRRDGNIAKCQVFSTEDAPETLLNGDAPGPPLSFGSQGCNFMNFSKNIRCLKCKTEEMMLKLRKEIEIAHDVNQLLYVVYGLLTHLVILRRNGLLTCLVIHRLSSARGNLQQICLKLLLMTFDIEQESTICELSFGGDLDHDFFLDANIPTETNNHPMWHLSCSWRMEEDENAYLQMDDQEIRMDLLFNDAYDVNFFTLFFCKVPNTLSFLAVLFS